MRKKINGLAKLAISGLQLKLDNSWYNIFTPDIAAALYKAIYQHFSLNQGVRSGWAGFGFYTLLSFTATALVIKVCKYPAKGESNALDSSREVLSVTVGYKDISEQSLKLLVKRGLEAFPAFQAQQKKWKLTASA
ncbi:MAG: hypothetical protein H0Z35_13370 [Thermoanaerobacteraceae bacterium]|nr:hypothetical protein [Thermoanaerobacteraceae bacterium]